MKITLPLFIAVPVLLLGQITNHPLASPSLLEVNLGPTPISYYSSQNCQPGYSDCGTNVQHRFVAPCSASSTVRQCYISALNAYAQQEHVTGVRFQFALCGGWYSTPLSGCGTPTVTFDPGGSWQQQLGYFFLDIYNSGIRNITPTFSLAGFSGDAGVRTTTDPTYDTCHYGGYNVALVWWPALPFALRSSDGYAYGWNNSPAYSCAAFNTVTFVGYTTLYTVMDNLLRIAASTPSTSNHLNVEEFDINNETPVDHGTVWARLVFDNKDPSVPLPGRHVLDEWRYYMGQHGYSWTSVTFSLLAGGFSSAPGYDCPSVYGDWARLLPESEFVAMVGGGSFGWPNPSWTNNLPCGGSASALYGPLPMSYSEPAILDMHTGPCLTDSSNNCVIGQSQSSAALEAQYTFSDTEAFLNTFCPTGWRHNSTQLCGALYMQGEVPAYQPQPYPPGNPQLNCDGSPVTVPAGAVQGFNSSTLAGRRTSGGLPGVVFRPWVLTSQGFMHQVRRKHASASRKFSNQRSCQLPSEG